MLYIPHFVSYKTFIIDPKS